MSLCLVRSLWGYSFTHKFKADFPLLRIPTLYLHCSSQSSTVGLHAVITFSLSLLPSLPCILCSLAYPRCLSLTFPIYQPFSNCLFGILKLFAVNLNVWSGEEASVSSGNTAVHCISKSPYVRESACSERAEDSLCSTLLHSTTVHTLLHSLPHTILNHLAVCSILALITPSHSHIHCMF